MKKYIVFDIDRTIINSYEAEILSLKEAIENVTNNKLSREVLDTLSQTTTDIFFKKQNYTNQEVSKINKEWDKTLQKYKITCFNGIVKVINELFKEGYILGIITSRTIDEYHELDEELKEISPVLKIVVTSDLVKNPKPHIDCLNYLCKNLNCTKDEIIYIGDNNIDKTFAKNCNITFIPACWENKELINEKNACIKVEKLLEIIKREGE